MNARTHPPGVTVMVLALLPMLAAAADQVAVDATGLENLGVTLASPRPVSSAAGAEVRARVVIPPSREHVVSPMLSGVVDRVHVVSGQPVRQGELLAEVRSSEFIGLQREFVAALVEAGLAQSSLVRDRQLVEEGIASRRRLEETQATAGAARARLNAARELLRQAGLDEAGLEALGSRQSFTPSLPLRAPIDGVVTEASAMTGEQVSALSPLYRVADLSELWLEIQLPQALMSAAAEGTPVFSPDGEETIGRVLNVGRVVDPETQIAVARAEITGGGGDLRPGQFTSVRLGAAAGDVTGLVTVPVSAVLRSGDAAYVFVRTETGFEVRPVRIVSAEGNVVYLDGGPGPNESVAVSGVAALKALWLGGAGEDG